jgi:hypothetical protein
MAMLFKIIVFFIDRRVAALFFSHTSPSANTCPSKQDNHNTMTPKQLGLVGIVTWRRKICKRSIFAEGAMLQNNFTCLISKYIKKIPHASADRWVKAKT